MREKVECDTQYRVGCFGCTLVSEESGTCVVRDCRICDIAIGYVRRKNLKDREDSIPTISKIHNGIKYLSNPEGNIGLMCSFYDAINVFPFDYKPIGYSANIIKIYSLMSVIRTVLHLPIPDKIWWCNNSAPLIIEYIGIGRVYAIASKIPRFMIKK